MTFTGSLIAIAWKLIDQKFKYTARLADCICHTKFHCRLHYDRHIEIDHANIKVLDKYNLAKLYEKPSNLPSFWTTCRPDVLHLHCVSLSDSKF